MQPHTGASRTHDALRISERLERGHSTAMRKWKLLFVNLVENGTAFLNACQDGENVSVCLAIVWEGSAINESRLTFLTTSPLVCMCQETLLREGPSYLPDYTK